MSYPIAEISEEVKESGHTGKYRRSVMRRYGASGFDNKGRILQSVIDQDEKSSNPTIRKEAVLAKTYHRINVGKKSFAI